MRRSFWFKTIGAVLLAGVTLFLLWWVWSAGPRTAWKILASNTSGIEDYKIFPIRKLFASAQPFQFKAREGQLSALDKVSIAGDPRTLNGFIEETGTVAFLVIRDDVLLVEEYAHGYDRSTPVLAFSMSKSILSMLIGTALDDGYIESVDQAVTDYVPELAGKGFDRVTLRHLLQMTSGMDYVEVEGNPFSLHARFYYTDRLEHELLSLSLAQEPGQEFSYKTGENALLGLILSRALAPMTITEYTQLRLWDPLGMAYGGGWSLDHPGGLEKTWCCLSATAVDYARLGRLYLNRGNWQGAQLIPETWIAESTCVDTRAGSVWNYQYQWWLVSEDGGDFTAMGHLGQFIYVNPLEEMIIVRLGKGMGGLEWEDWQMLFHNLAVTTK